MELAQLCPKRLSDALSARSSPRALSVLAEATSATTTLLDPQGRVLIGPIAGSGLVRQLLTTEAGRELVLAAHRSAARFITEPEAPSDQSLLARVFDHFAIPLTIKDHRVGTLTLGDRPRLPVPVETVEDLARLAGLDGAALRRAAAELPLWSAPEASRARELATLLAELFTELCAQDADLQHRIEELSAVYNISGLVAGDVDIQVVLNKIARLVCEVMKVKACSIRLLDETTGQLSVRAVHNLSEEYLNKGPVTVDQNPIDAAALSGEIVRIANAPTDARVRYPLEARKEGIVSGLFCGMIYRGEPVGVLRVYTGEPHVFSPFEESLLQAVASQTAAAIINARLFADALQAERVARQLQYAGEVQRRMIPTAPPCCERIQIGTVYRPTFQVGGDFYDFIVLPKHNLGVAIADVSGKGVPASLQMASLRSALRVNAYHMYDIDRILGEVNRHLCRDNKVGEFASVFYGVINTVTGRFTFCNAGHNPPLLLRKGEITRLETGGTVLGIDPNATFDRGIVNLETNDLVLLYTDGTVEAVNFADAQFGLPRLADSLRQHAEQPAPRVVQNILWDIRRFRGLADRTDDLTMVALKVGPPATVSEPRP